MIDYVVRPLAGLLMCLAFGGLILSLPSVIEHVRARLVERREASSPAPVAVPDVVDETESDSDEDDEEPVEASATAADVRSDEAKPERKAS